MRGATRYAKVQSCRRVMQQAKKSGKQVRAQAGDSA